MKNVKAPFCLKMYSRLNTEIELIPTNITDHQVLISVSKVREAKLTDVMCFSLNKDEINDLIELLSLSLELTKKKQK